MQSSMDTMSWPTPEDPGRAPVWDNYVIAQTVQASLGGIPPHAVAMGVRVAGTEVQLCFRLTELTDDDVEDMDDIVSELEALVGNHVHVDKRWEIRETPGIASHDGIAWIYAVHWRSLT